MNRELASLREAYRRLGRREGEVLYKILQGKTNRQIASEMFVSVKTVENHITRIGTELGLKGKGKVRNWAEELNQGLR